MAVLSHSLHWNGATGSWESGKRQYAAVYLVRTNSALDGPQTIISYFYSQFPTLPVLGSTYAYGNDADPFAFCSRIDPQYHSDRSRTLWAVACSFETRDQDQQEKGRDKEGNPTDNPLEFHAEIEISKAQFMRPVWSAWNLTPLPGRPINTRGAVTNSAGVVLDPPLEKPQTDMVYRIRKNMDHFPDSLAREYQDTINDDKFTLHSQFHEFTTTFLKYEALLANMGGSFNARVINVGGNDQLIKYWRNDYEIHARQGGWIEEVPDRGRVSKAAIGDPDGRGGIVGFKPDGSAMDTLEFAEAFPPGVPPQRVHKDPWGENIDDSILLDGAGHPLDPGAATVWIKWRTLPEKPFDALNISDPLP
jgi:hypothetical protein